jgi:hypothetical protein
MRIEKGHNHIFHLILSSYELAALISSARSIISDLKKDELTPESVEYLKHVLANYDKAEKRFIEKQGVRGTNRTNKREKKVIP